MTLTPRQIQIATLLARGLPAKQVAFEMKIAQRTVLRHTERIYESAGVHDRIGLVLYLVRKGIIKIEVEARAVPEVDKDVA
jgi:DNA-binding NarL/FixJ family response regulator